MTSGFEAPSGPPAFVPPPPPGSGAVPPPPPPASPAPSVIPPAPDAASPASPPPSPAAEAPPVGTTTVGASSPDANARGDRHDLSALLDQLHDELHVDPSAAPFEADAPLTDPRDLERPASETIVIESTGGLDFRPNFATFGARFVGALVDGIALTLAMVPGLLILLLTSGGSNTLLGLVVLVVGFVTANLWYARSVARTGQWFGNRVAKTKVVSATNGAHLDGGFAFLRFAARHLISAILLIGFLIAFTDSQRRTFHDRLAGSVVVGRARATWSADDDAA